MELLDLLVHPVRLRIIHAFSGDRELTTIDLTALLPDVPKTSLYRHVSLLADEGVLEVCAERRVRGAVERRYRLRRDRPVLGADAAAMMGKEDHRRAFAAALAALHAEFNAYLDRPDADPAADRVGYRQGVVWLSNDEFAELIGEMATVLARSASNAPTPGRAPRLLSLVHFPAAEPVHR
jgi:DNA-binding transcriptional ArsR family regulator